MRRIAMLAVALLPALTSPLAAQAPAQAGPPHAWLFGSWIGGMFPPPVTLNAQECLAQPMVIFTRDVVLRAVMASSAYTQRLIETARATPTGFEVRLVPAAPAGTERATDLSFGCADPNMLPVQRRGENEITLPGCKDFPYPLIRCGTR
jgi:hypothetical protein